MLLLMIIYLLLVPIILFIDTSTNQYFIKVKGIAKASIESDKLEVFKIRLKVFFFNFYFYPLKNNRLVKLNKDKKKVVKKKNFKWAHFTKVLRVVRSFKIKQFQLDIDTGDCIINSKLFPVFAFLNFYNHTHCSVNFESRNSVLLSLENRPIRIIKSIINI
jgi:hypothetical protein